MTIADRYCAGSVARFALAATPLFLVAVWSVPGRAEAGWVVKKRSGLSVRSSKGQALFSYAVSHPAKWRFVQKSVGALFLPPKRGDVAFAVKPIHKGDAGPEQLLNQKGGLKKWVARVQPTSRLLKVHKIKVMGSVRELLELKGTNAARSFFFYVLLVKVKDVNLVIIAGGPLKEQGRFKKVYWEMLKRLKASSP